MLSLLSKSPHKVWCSFGYSRFELQLDDSTLQAYGYGVGPVVHAKFGENTLDVPFDRVQRDLQLIGDQLVGISACNKGQNVDFSLTQSIISSMAPTPVSRRR